MNEFVKRHWTTLLGALFVLLALIYFFKYAIDQGWLFNELIIGIGLLFGASFILSGIKLFVNKKNLASETIIGLGVVLLFTTFSFAGIYYDMWTPMTVFLSMIAVTFGIAIYAFRLNLRILMNISLLGALIAPMVLKSQGDQMFTLFLYLLVINFVFFTLSVLKSWIELRPVAFFGTWILFTIYYFYFNPTIWYYPYRYAAAAFLFYVIALIISSWKENLKFDGLNLYLGVINAILFGIWSFEILAGLISFSIPLAAMGLVFLLASASVYYLTRELNIPVVTKLIGGLLLLLISVSNVGQGLEIKPLISVYIWTFVAGALLFLAQMRNLDYLKLTAIGIWVATGIYWFSTTWETPLGIWFNIFIPFFNTSGMAWILLAIFGFYCSVKLKLSDQYFIKPKVISNFCSISSHFIVGGLLTFQIMNLYRFYDLNFMDENLTLSISWGIYALLLFLWGAYSNQSFFRWFGSIVLVLVALKTIFIDLSGSETLYKVIVLLILGIISFGISAINNKWKDKEESTAPEIVPPTTTEQQTKQLD